MAGQYEALAVAERGAADDVVPDAFDVEPGAGAQRILYETRERGLAFARRGDGHEVPRGCEEIAHRSGAGAVVPQDLVQLRLVVALPFAEPLDHEDARHEELPARVLAPAAGPDGDAPGGHDPA